MKYIKEKIKYNFLSLLYSKKNYIENTSPKNGFHKTRDGYSKYSEGSYKDGKKHGFFTFKSSPLKKIMSESGLYNNDKKEGIWKRYIHIKDKKNVINDTTFINIDNYKDGLLNGLSKSFEYSNGIKSMKSFYNYKKGILHGVSRYYKSPESYDITLYIKGEKNSVELIIVNGKRKILYYL